MKKAFYRESLLWKNLILDHVVPLLGVSEDVFGGTICMVLPWMERGSLLHYIDEEKRKGNLSGDSELVPTIDNCIKQHLAWNIFIMKELCTAIFMLETYSWMEKALRA